jgi:hypothetical protein
MGPAIAQGHSARRLTEILSTGSANPAVGFAELFYKLGFGLNRNIEIRQPVRKLI